MLVRDQDHKRGESDSPIELFGQTLLGAKVARRIKGQRRYGRTTVGVAPGIAVDSANGPKSPSRRVSGRICDAVGGSLQEPNLVLRVTMDTARQDDEELHDDASGEDELAQQAEDWSWGM